MSVIHIPTDIFEWISKPFILIGIVLLAFIILYHIITIQKNTAHGINCKTLTCSVQLSFVLLVLSAWILINLCLHIFDPFESVQSCQYTQYIGIAGYTLFKLTMHLILISRLHESFKNSFLQYNKRKLQIWALFLIIWAIFSIILNIIYSSSYLDLQSIPHCIIEYKPQTIILIALLDITSSTVNSYLFIKPVLKIRGQLQIDDSKLDETRDLKNVALKQCILSMIAVISTLIAIIMVVLTGMRHVFGAIDINISCLSIILMYRWNSKTVEKIFFCCLESTDIKNLKMTVNNKSDCSVITTSTKESKETDQGAIDTANTTKIV